MKTLTFVLRVSLRYGPIAIWNRHREESVSGETTHFLDCCCYELHRPSIGYHRVTTSASDTAPVTVAAVVTRKGTVIHTGERAT